MNFHHDDNDDHLMRDALWMAGIWLAIFAALALAGY